MRKAFSAIRSNIRSLGWWNGLLYMLGAALSRVSRDRVRLVKYHLVVQPVHTQPLLPPHRGKNIRISEAGPNDPLLSTVRSRREGVFHERFDQGGRCLVAELKGELAGFLWFTQGDYPEDEVRCLFRPLPPGKSVWDYDVYVAGKHRLSPVFLRLWQAANERLHAEGVRHSCSRISAFNPASRGSHARLGAQHVGSAIFLCLGPWQLTTATVAPYLHISLDSRTRPLIELQPPR